MALRFNETIKRHIADNLVSYGIILFFFILGVSLGAVTVSKIAAEAKSDIKEYINGFITITSTDSIQSIEMLKQSIKFNLLTSGALFLAGLTYAGIVIVPLIVTFRGFCLGFTVAFLADSLKSGFLLSLVSILPQNLIYLPVIIIFSVCSLSLAFVVLKAKMNKSRGEVANYIWSFAVTAIFLFLIMLAGSIIESYITPYLVKLTAPYLL